MSLKGSDGSSLAAHVRPLLGWELIRGEQLARVLGNMEDVLGTLEDDLFPGAIIPRVMDREMHYYAVAPTHAQQQRLLACCAPPSVAQSRTSRVNWFVSMRGMGWKLC